MLWGSLSNIGIGVSASCLPHPASMTTKVKVSDMRMVRPVLTITRGRTFGFGNMLRRRAFRKPLVFIFECPRQFIQKMPRNMNASRLTERIDSQICIHYNGN